MVEDEFFRQLADGALADNQPAVGSARPEDRGSPRPNGQPPRRPPARRGGPHERKPSPPRSGPPRPRGTSSTARGAALAAVALAGAALAALLFGSSGAGDSAKRPGEVGEQPGPPNGRPATADARLSAWWPAARGQHTRELEVSWRPRGRAVIAGRLTDASDRPIADARVSVLAADGSNPEQGSRTVGEVRTDRLGRFSAAIALDRGAPRKLLTFTYLARSGDKVPAATVRTELAVRGTVSVRPPTRRTQRGRSVVLEGRGPAGATVQVLVREPGLRLWRIRSSAPASRTGRWEAALYIPSYVPRGTYRMRARVLGGQRRGFLPANSRPVRVQVR